MDLQAIARPFIRVYEEAPNRLLRQTREQAARVALINGLIRRIEQVGHYENQMERVVEIHQMAHQQYHEYHLAEVVLENRAMELYSVMESLRYLSLTETDEYYQISECHRSLLNEYRTWLNMFRQPVAELEGTPEIPEILAEMNDDNIARTCLQLMLHQPNNGTIGERLLTIRNAIALML